MKAADMMPIHKLMADIRATFPLLLVEKRSTSLGTSGCFLRWMVAASDQSLMPGGGLMLDDCSDDDTYRCGVHVAFDRWLQARGWYLERNDDFWFIPEELPTDEDLARWADERRAYELATQGPQLPARLDIPF